MSSCVYVCVCVWVCRCVSFFPYLLIISLAKDFLLLPESRNLECVCQVSVQHHSWFKRSIGCTHWRLLLHFILSCTEHRDPRFWILGKSKVFFRSGLNFVEMVEIKSADVSEQQPSPVNSIGLNVSKVTCNLQAVSLWKHFMNN